jgi:hypothetical protein
MAAVAENARQASRIAAQLLRLGAKGVRAIDPCRGVWRERGIMAR